MFTLLLDLGLVNLIYLFLIICSILLEVLPMRSEWMLTKIVNHIYLYGKLSSTEFTLLSVLNVPKSWFRHFYFVASIWASCGLYLILNTYALDVQCPERVYNILDTLHGSQRAVKGNVSSRRFFFLNFLYFQFRRQRQR